ncbi:hypothetical protein [Flavobacterium defluvii]|uniref:Tetratricopeptide repeat-containing protein n=1 Tax=Flavobacterium defluvii TaxID=370979 RepID=A0A1M5VMI0_9FLAO|nr:hypothetical protein [Flavobacterium defluvii]SHH76254.1 hypothetical protein SAMN05443663_11153 [Flavobacterium defluvii]
MKTSKIFLILLLLLLNIQKGNSQTSEIIDTEYNLRGTYYAVEPIASYRNKEKDSNYYLLLAKRYLEAPDNNPHKYQNAVDNLRNSLLLDKNNREAFELQSQTNFDFAMKSLERGEREFKSGDFSEGYYFYKALEHLSNAYLNGFKKEEIIGYTEKINAILKDSKKKVILFDAANLYKISTVYQEKNTASYDSIKKIYKEKKADPNADKNELLNILKKRQEYAEYYFDNNKWEPNAYKDTTIERAKLGIEMGDTENACSLLYHTDLLEFYNYNNNACKAWYDKFSKAENIRIGLERKEAVKKWHAEHPNKIKLRSLIGENDEIVQSYLGAPIAKNFKMSIGEGLNKNQYSANRYKTKNGTYEIAFKNNNATRIQFFPLVIIKFDPNAFELNDSTFDQEVTNKPGSCFASFNDGFSGKTKIFSIDYTCEYFLASTQFYGTNGKVTSVVVY